MNLDSIRLTTLTIQHTSLWLFVDCRQVQVNRNCGVVCGGGRGSEEEWMGQGITRNGLDRAGDEGCFETAVASLVTAFGQRTIVSLFLSDWESYGDLRNIKIAPCGTLRLSCRLELLGSSFFTERLGWSWWAGIEGRKERLGSSPRASMLID